ncbi:MAG: UDP-glucose/GDP-mannose dehydrogenase family protein, partial [Chloroflexi bacterium]|nr:UDP-glucose/GDP-mannose dehydrogenase family protein [Chloroflexota bacterium]
MKQIAVIGVGYVGLVTAACFSDLGNKVIAMDISDEKVKGLKRGEMPIYEPGLEELVERNVNAGRITFTTSIEEALEGSEYVFICVGTPSGVDGEADLNYVESAAKAIAENMTAPIIVINKSTVPVGTGDWVADIVKTNQKEAIKFSVVSCPEFLREGSAIADFMNP